MKVVISTYTFLPDIGGVATQVSILAHGLVSEGHEVTIATLTPGPSEGYGFKVVRNPSLMKLTALYQTADILILSNLSLKLLYPALVRRRPFGLWHHSESAFQLSASPFSRDALRRSVMNRAVNFMTSEYVGKRSGLNNYVVVHPFANPLHIDLAKASPPKGRQGKMVFVGRLEAEKGLLYLLDHWPKIREKLNLSELRIIGDGPLRAELQSRIAAAATDVTYVGRLPLDKTASEMQSAAYSIVPSLWAEPFGAVALESVAAGAITLLTNRGGLPETTGGLGYMFDPDDEGSLESALDAARDQFDRHLASATDRAAYEEKVACVVQDFTPSAAAKKIIKVFTDVTTGAA